MFIFLLMSYKDGINMMNHNLFLTLVIFSCLLTPSPIVAKSSDLPLHEALRKVTYLAPKSNPSAWATSFPKKKDRHFYMKTAGTKHILKRVTLSSKDEIEFLPPDKFNVGYSTPSTRIEHLHSSETDYDADESKCSSSSETDLFRNVSWSKGGVEALLIPDNKARQSEFGRSAVQFSKFLYRRAKIQELEKQKKTLENKLKYKSASTIFDSINLDAYAINPSAEIQRVEKMIDTMSKRIGGLQQKLKLHELARMNSLLSYNTKMMEISAEDSRSQKEKSAAYFCSKKVSRRVREAERSSDERLSKYDKISNEAMLSAADKLGKARQVYVEERRSRKSGKKSKAHLSDLNSRETRLNHAKELLEAAAELADEDEKKENSTGSATSGIVAENTSKRKRLQKRVLSLLTQRKVVDLLRDQVSHTSKANEKTGAEANNPQASEDACAEANGFQEDERELDAFAKQLDAHVDQMSKISDQADCLQHTIDEISNASSQTDALLASSESSSTGRAEAVQRVLHESDECEGKKSTIPVPKDFVSRTSETVPAKKCLRFDRLCQKILKFLQRQPRWRLYMGIYVITAFFTQAFFVFLIVLGGDSPLWA